MKKAFLLSIISLFLVQLTHAQETTSERKYRLGFQVSPEFDWMKAKSKNAKNNANKFGFAFGPVFEYNFSQNYAFFTGVNITSFGGELFFKDTVKFNSQKDITYSQSSEAHYKLKYIEIPLIIKLKTNEIGYMTYFGQFGISPGVNIGANGDLIDHDDPSKTKIDEDMGSNVFIGNVSMVLGAGAAYSVTTTTSIYVSGSFTNGFIDAVRNPKDYPTKAVINRISISVGVLF